MDILNFLYNNLYFIVIIELIIFFICWYIWGDDGLIYGLTFGLILLISGVCIFFYNFKIDYDGFNNEFLIDSPNEV